jgi:multiple sugar transport system ATP-binding protein
VTHDQVEAMTLASQVVVMNQGLIMQQGRPLEVYNNPKNLFVAGFIGSPSMNFMNGHVGEENGSLTICGEGFKLLVPKPLYDRYAPAKNREVILGIRPEHIHDAAITGSFPGGESLAVTVEVIEPLGSVVLIIATCGSLQVMASVDSKTKAQPRTEMRLLVDMNRMHLFDKSTGEAY